MKLVLKAESFPSLWHIHPRGHNQRYLKLSSHLQLYQMTLPISQNLFLSSSEAKVTLDFQRGWQAPSKKTFFSLLQPILTFLSFQICEQSVLLLSFVAFLRFYDLIFDTGCPSSKDLNPLPQHNMLQHI